MAERRYERSYEYYKQTGNEDVKDFLKEELTRSFKNTKEGNLKEKIRNMLYNLTSLLDKLDKE